MLRFIFLLLLHYLNIEGSCFHIYHLESIHLELITDGLCFLLQKDVKALKKM